MWGNARLSRERIDTTAYGLKGGKFLRSHCDSGSSFFSQSDSYLNGSKNFLCVFKAHTEGNPPGLLRLQWQSSCYGWGSSGFWDMGAAALAPMGAFKHVFTTSLNLQLACTE